MGSRISKPVFPMDSVKALPIEEPPKAPSKQRRIIFTRFVTTKTHDDDDKSIYGISTRSINSCDGSMYANDSGTNLKMISGKSRAI